MEKGCPCGQPFSYRLETILQCFYQEEFDVQEWNLILSEQGKPDAEEE